ncbi:MULTISPECIES: PP2C family protein-serine/threonine phosphatase [unclassified Nocardioides]|uniref:PP2C family protein-serine/threonine phosphatase n=1 Tax=unclassified Nocardioides TaxID=2615069 RepID=UPI00360E14B2
MDEQTSTTVQAAQGLVRWGQREERMDRITRLAQRIFGVVWTSITVLDEHRAWFPSAQGFDIQVMPRHDSFCHTASQYDTTTLVADATLDERFRELPAVVDRGIRFYAGVPLRDATGTTVAVLCLYDDRVRNLDDDDLLTLTDLAAWAEQELLSSAEMVRAAQVQTSMLPSGPIRMAGWDIHGVCLPALAVGGDGFDYSVDEDVLHVGLGDVMGKGTGAALLGAGIRAATRATHAAVVAGVDLGVTVTQIARTLSDDLERADAFVTLFEGAVDLDDGYLRYVDAGMGLCLVVRADGAVERLLSDDLPIGVLADSHWTEHSTTIEPGDRMLVFSDGLLELLDDQQTWWQPVGEMVAAHEDATALLTTIARLTGTLRPPDDVTAVAVFRKPMAGQA